MGNADTILHQCLFFTTNALARTVTRMADEAFRPTGLSPSHALLVMLVNERGGSSQKELCQGLQLAPSTVTRFVDALIHRGFLRRESRGKGVWIFPTENGRGLQKPIADAWIRLYRRYTEILGMADTESLTRQMDAAGRALSEGRWPDLSCMCKQKDTNLTDA